MIRTEQPHGTSEHTSFVQWFEKFPFLKALGACCGKQSNKFHKFENEMSTITDPSERDAELVPENGVGDEKPNSL